MNLFYRGLLYSFEQVSHSLTTADMKEYRHQLSFQLRVFCMQMIISFGFILAMIVVAVLSSSSSVFNAYMHTHDELLIVSIIIGDCTLNSCCVAVGVFHSRRKRKWLQICKESKCILRFCDFFFGIGCGCCKLNESENIDNNKRHHRNRALSASAAVAGLRNITSNISLATYHSTRRFQRRISASHTLFSSDGSGMGISGSSFMYSRTRSTTAIPGLIDVRSGGFKSIQPKKIPIVTRNFSNSIELVMKKDSKVGVSSPQNNSSIGSPAISNYSTSIIKHPTFPSIVEGDFNHEQEYEKQFQTNDNSSTYTTALRISMFPSMPNENPVFLSTNYTSEEAIPVAGETEEYVGNIATMLQTIGMDGQRLKLPPIFSNNIDHDKKESENEDQDINQNIIRKILDADIRKS